MCVIYHMNYEFNNWKAFYSVIDFIIKRHPHNYPTFNIKTPLCSQGSTWYEWDETVNRLKGVAPDNLEEMSIYGVISFEVTKDENLNIIV